MKGLLGLLGQSAARSGDERIDSVMFSTAFADQGVDPSKRVPWEARANEVGAKGFSASRGSKLLQGLWAKDKYMAGWPRLRCASSNSFLTFPPCRQTATSSARVNTATS